MTSNQVNSSEPASHPQEPMKVLLMLDPQPLSTKPPKGTTLWGGINARIATNTATLTIPELADRVTRGHTFAPGVFHGGKRNRDSWVQQQVFGLDCEKGYGFKEFLELCQQWDVWPAFIYPTFSHTDDAPRFRAVFVCDQIIRDGRLHELIQGLLMGMFDGKHINKPQTIDKACKDKTRIFLGTGQPLVYEKFDAVINPLELLAKYLRYRKENDPAHYAEWEEKLASDYHIGPAGSRRIGVVSKFRLEENQTVFSQTEMSGEDNVGTILHNTQTVNKPEVSPFTEVLVDGEPYLILWILEFEKTKKTQNKRARAVNAFAPNKPTVRLTKEGKEILLEKCKLVRELMSGERRLGHNDRRTLISNLRHRQGGLEWFRKGLEARDDYFEDSLIDDSHFYDWKPTGCSRCPHDRHCDHKTNLLQQIPPKRRECRQMKPSPPRKTVEETRQHLDDTIARCLAATDNKVFVIRCDTGVGKTERLLGQNLDGVCVAFDTHSLKREAHKRLKKPGPDVYVWPEPPELPGELHGLLRKYYTIGLGGTTDIYRLALEHPSVQKDPKRVTEIEAYLAALSEVFCQSSVFATHEKAYQLQRNPKLTTFIFDEDFSKTLIQVTEVKITDIEKARELIRKSGDERYKDIDEHLKAVLQAPTQVIHPQSVQEYQGNLIHSLLTSDSSSFNSPLEALFSCGAYCKDSPSPTAGNSIYCISRRELREDRKFVVFSATADETVYRLLFGDRLEFIDLGSTQLKGWLYCHTKKSFSKTQVASMKAKFGEQVTEDMARYGFKGIITHKSCSERLQDGTFLKHTEGKVPVLGTFGALQGLDSLAGKNMAVYGTPYPPPFVVKLWAHVLGMDVDPEQFEFRERLVEWGEFEGHIPTISDKPELQRVYLWLALSEIVQAVGRARLVSHECVVHVFSKLAVSGCVLNPKT